MGWLHETIQVIQRILNAGRYRHTAMLAFSSARDRYTAGVLDVLDELCDRQNGLCNRELSWIRNRGMPSGLDRLERTSHSNEMGTIRTPKRVADLEDQETQNLIRVKEVSLFCTHVSFCAISHAHVDLDACKRTPHQRLIFPVTPLAINLTAANKPSCQPDPTRLQKVRWPIVGPRAFAIDDQRLADRR